MRPSSPHDWVVLKFGGTSVSSRETWDTIARVVQARLEEGLRPLVVCSALSGISNLLEDILARAVETGADRSAEVEPLLAKLHERHTSLAAALGVETGALLAEDLEEVRRIAVGASLTGETSPRLRARGMAAGELLATRLGAAFLAREGLRVRWLDAREILRAAPDASANEHRRYLAADCICDPDDRLASRLAVDGAAVFVTQGFIAGNDAGETVLLGRGGSDTSAACLGAKLRARRLEIWTDVPGMFTADPRAIPGARLLRRLGYREAQELATMGAKVLHPRCLGPVRQLGIPLHIRCTPSPETEGTIVCDTADPAEAQVRAISSKAGVTLISMEALGMWQQVGFLSDVFAIFKRHGLSVDLIATSETNLTVTLDRLANALDPATIRALLTELNGIGSAHEIGPCAVVSLVGSRIRSILHEVGPALELFDEHRIYLLSQAASDLNFSFVVDEDQADRIVGKLHAHFFGDRAPDAVFGPAWTELFRSPEREAARAPVWWRRKRQALLAIASTSAPVYVYDEETLRRTVEEVRAIRSADRVFYALKANPAAEVLRVLESTGIGFECVSAGELRHLRALFPDLRGERILFTPNFAPIDEYEEAFEARAFVTLDNLEPLERHREVFRGREILVRVDPGRGHGHHRFVRTAGAGSKFGIEPADLPRVAEHAAAASARIIGLHAHLGSGIRTADAWSGTAAFLAGLADASNAGLPDLRILDLGGGFGVVDRPGTPPLDLAAVAANLGSVRQAHPRYELWIEPGRFLVAEAGVLLARVTQTKQKGGVPIIGLETGMNSLIRPALYGAYHEIVNLSRLDEPATLAAEVVGPICETGDVLGHGRLLPESTGEGDVVLIATAGAYGRAMSSSYNLREPATETLLRV